MPVATPIRVAAVLLWVVFGFRAYGGGPFERVGIQTTTSLLAAFMAECTLEGVAGAHRCLLLVGIRVADSAVLRTHSDGAHLGQLEHAEAQASASTRWSVPCKLFS
jgi:hypothetical protein